MSRPCPRPVTGLRPTPRCWPARTPADRPGRARPAPGRARDLDIATARQRVLQAVADLEQARALWLPSLFMGPTYYRADGQVQTITGQVVNVMQLAVPRLDGGAGRRFPAASPGTGYPQLSLDRVRSCGSPMPSSLWLRDACPPLFKPDSRPRPTTPCWRCPRRIDQLAAGADRTRGRRQRR